MCHLYISLYDSVALQTNKQTNKPGLGHVDSGGQILEVEHILLNGLEVVLEQRLQRRKDALLQTRLVVGLELSHIVLRLTASRNHIA